MEIRKGYKQTEVGVIPSDWEVMPLYKITSEIGDGIHSTPEYVKSSDFFFINGNNLVNNTIRITENTMCVNEEEFQKHKKKLSDQTILMSINGTIGNLAYFNNEKVILGKSAAYINVDNSTNKYLIFYLLQTTAVKNYFENELTGSTIRNLSLKAIRNTPAPLPPTKAEQTAIATALSDADAFISSLEKLIAKKRNIKQGTMQELLTGKKRLPGFSGEWEVKKLGELADIFKGRGLSKSKLNPSGIYKCLLYGELFTTYSQVIKNVISRTSTNEGVLSKKGDILMPGSTTTVGIDLAIASALLEDGILLGGDINIIRKKVDSYDSEFIAHYLTQVKKHEIAELSQGITIIHLYGRDLNALSITIPAKREEQATIAAILSDMNAEIEALEQKLEKCRMIKQGMMQELLTGKTRLV